ncbi:hypothetical protein IMCC9480_3051 [Oxalobacteraceae bacterium IMCC9480]|nr:hypothetical protein IMCC9480_3051 [Oxalobacteraceae bacterium IMCC9480]
MAGRIDGDLFGMHDDIGADAGRGAGSNDMVGHRTGTGNDAAGDGFLVAVERRHVIGRHGQFAGAVEDADGAPVPGIAEIFGSQIDRGGGRPGRTDPHPARGIGVILRRQADAGGLPQAGVAVDGGTQIDPPDGRADVFVGLRRDTRFDRDRVTGIERVDYLRRRVTGPDRTDIAIARTDLAGTGTGKADEDVDSGTGLRRLDAAVGGVGGSGIGTEILVAGAGIATARVGRIDIDGLIATDLLQAVAGAESGVRARHQNRQLVVGTQHDAATIRAVMDSRAGRADVVGVGTRTGTGQHAATTGHRIGDVVVIAQRGDPQAGTGETDAAAEVRGRDGIRFGFAAGSAGSNQANDGAERLGILLRLAVGRDAGGTTDDQRGVVGDVTANARWTKAVAIAGMGIGRRNADQRTA